MRISDWSSDVCSSDLEHDRFVGEALVLEFHLFHHLADLEIGWAIDDQADRTVIAVLAEQGNGVREVLVVETRHRDQELMLQVVLVAHGRSIGKRCAGDKRRAAGRCIPALQRRALIASISWPPMSVPYAVSISRAQVEIGRAHV